MPTPNPIECNNCHGKKFQKIEGIYALTKVEKNNEQVNFLPASGIPVLAYICTDCGEIKLYPAKLFGEI